MDDITLNKVAAIERCLARVREEYDGNPDSLRDNLTRQDSIILNLQRACETAIDLAMHWVRLNRLGVPQQSRDAFRLLVQAKTLPEALGEALEKMVGFRNIAVHDYQALNLDVVQAIVETKMDDLAEFARLALGGALRVG